MARSWHYPRSRRILMQGVFVAILAGTIGLAELVTQQRNKPQTFQLTQTRRIDNFLSVKIPTNWSIEVPADSDSLVAREPGRVNGRVFSVSIKRVRGVRSPEEFLQRSGLLSGSANADSDSDSETDSQEDSQKTKSKLLIMAGQPAAMAQLLAARGTPPVIRAQYYVVAILPGEVAIILFLESPEVDESDAVLVQQLAAAMSIPEPPPSQNPSNTAIPVHQLNPKLFSIEPLNVRGLSQLSPNPEKQRSSDA